MGAGKKNEGEFWEAELVWRDEDVRDE